jgi:hypothetical protein
MPQDPSQMAGPTPAFMNQPQYQQQMQSLAMQVRQQEDGIKRTKKFLKAYEDIQLAQPMPMQQPQQPAFMQPPGGMAQAMNNNLPQVEEPAMSFTEMAGGMGGGEMAGAEMGGGEDMGMVGEMGAEGEVGPEGQQPDYGPPREQPFEGKMRPSQPSGSPGDPGLAKRGKDASSPMRQAERVALNEAGKQNAQNAAFDKVVKENSWTGMPSWIEELSDWVFKAKREVEIGKNTDASPVEMKVLKRTLKDVQTDLKNAKKIDKSIAEKLKKIASSIPNKAISAGLSGAMGGNLMADAHRYARGGIDEQGATYHPSEIQNVEGVNRIRSAVEELAYYHPDNADLHPEVTDADRKKYNPNWFK